MVPVSAAIEAELSGMSAEDKVEFLKRMHEMVLAKIGSKKPGTLRPETYEQLWQTVALLEEDEIESLKLNFRTSWERFMI